MQRPTGVRLRRLIAAATAGVLLGSLLTVVPAVVPGIPIASASASGDVCDPAHPEYDVIVAPAGAEPAPRAFCAAQEESVQRLLEEVWGWEYTPENRRFALVHHRADVAAATWIGLLDAWPTVGETGDANWGWFQSRVFAERLINPIALKARAELEAWNIQVALNDPCGYSAPPGFTFDPCPPQQSTHMVALWNDEDRTLIAPPTRDELLEWGVSLAVGAGTLNLGNAATRQNIHAGLRAVRQQLADFDRLGADLLFGNREALLDAVASLGTSTGVFSLDREQPEVLTVRLESIIRDAIVVLGKELGAIYDATVKNTLEDLTHNNFRFRILIPSGKQGPWSPITYPSWMFLDSLHLGFSTLAFFLAGVNWTSPLAAPASSGETRWFKVTVGDWTRITQELPLRVGPDDARVTARLRTDGTWVITPTSGPNWFSRELVYTAPAGDLKSLGVTPNYFRLLDLRGHAPGLPSCSLTPGCVISPFFWARVSDEFDQMVIAKIEFLGAPMVVTDHIEISDTGTENIGTLLTTSVRAIASYDTTYRFEWEITRSGGLVAVIETEQIPDFAGPGGIGRFEHRFAVPGDYAVTLRVHTHLGEISEPWVQNVHVPVPPGWVGQEQNGLLVTVHPDNWDGSTAPSTMVEGPWDEYATTGSVCLTTGWSDGIYHYNIRQLTTNSFFADAEEYWQGENRVGWMKDADSDLGYTCFNRDPDSVQLAGSYRLAARTFTDGTCNDNPRRVVTSGTQFVPGIFGCGTTDDDATRFTLEIANQDPTTPVLETRWGSSASSLNSDTGQVVGAVGDTITLAISRTGGIPERLSYEIAWVDDTFDELPNLRASFPAHDCMGEGVWCTIEHVFEAPIAGAAVTVVAVDRSGGRSAVATQYFTIEPGAPSIADRDTELSDNNLATVSGVIVDPWLQSTKLVVDWQDGTATEEHAMPLPVDIEGRFTLSHHYGYRGTFSPTFTFFADVEVLGTVTWEPIATVNFAPVVLVEPIVSHFDPDDADGPWSMGAWVLGYDQNPSDGVGVCVVWDYESHPTEPTSQSPDVTTSPDDSDSCTDAGGVELAFPENTGSFADYLVPDHVYTDAGYYTIAFFPFDLVGGSGADRNVGPPTFRTIAVGIPLTFVQQDALLPQVTGNPPVIRGIPSVGQQLTAELGLWQPDYTFPLGYYFQWLRDGIPIHDSDWLGYPLQYDDPDYDWPNHGRDYVVQAADQGKNLTVRVRSVSPQTRPLRLVSDPVLVPYSVTWEGIGLGLQVDEVVAATKTVTVSGIFLDEGRYVVDRFIDWGDGVVEPFVAEELDFGYFRFTLSHSYTSSDDYEITATLVNDVGGEIPEAVWVEVPKTPANWTSLSATVVSGTLTVQVAGTYADPDEWVAYGVIEWGDGDFSAFVIADGSFSAGWSYTSPGSYQLRAILTGPGGEMRVRTTEVVVPPSGGGSSGSGGASGGSSGSGEPPGAEDDPDSEQDPDGETPVTPPEDPGDGGTEKPGGGSTDPDQAAPEPGESSEFTPTWLFAILGALILGALLWMMIRHLRRLALRE